MKAMLLQRTGTPLEYREVPIPEAAGGEVVKVSACGVCHTDLHVANGDLGQRGPMILGHEVVAEHPDLGRVIVYAPWGCRRPSCRPCSEGKEMICPDSHEAGMVDDGGYAQFMRVPSADYLVPIGDLDPFTTAPLACGGLTAFRATRRALSFVSSRRNARIAIIGAGGLGQYSIQFLKQLADVSVSAVDLSEEHRRRAVALGADEAMEPGDLDGKFDAVIDFVSTDETLASAASRLHREGVLVAVGLFGGRLPFGVGAVPSETVLTTSVWGSLADLRDLLEHVHVHDVQHTVEILPLSMAQSALDRVARFEVQGRIVLDPAR
jgi:alcohol dehydrogenase, propanol-preferring